MEDLLKLGFKKLPLRVINNGNERKGWFEQNEEFKDIVYKLKKANSNKIPDLAGVYVFVNKKSKMVEYIGQSVHIIERLRRHKKYSLKDYFIFYKRVYKKDKLDEVEERLIKIYSPTGNSDKIEFNLFSREDRFKKWLSQFQLNENTIKLYTYHVNKYLGIEKDKPNKLLKNNNLDYPHSIYINQESMNRYIKEHPRHYVLSAMRYLSEFMGVEFKFPRRLKEPDKHIKNYSKREELIDKLEKLRNINKDAYWVAKLLWFTGARVSEILKLKGGDIERESEGICINTKGGYYRCLYIPDLELYKLRSYIKNNGVLANEKCFFKNCKKITTSYQRFREIIEKIDDERCVKELKRTHNFRRAMINWLLGEVNNNIFAVKEFIGHKSLTTTQEYMNKKTAEKMRKIAKEVVFKDAKIRENIREKINNGIENKIEHEAYVNSNNKTIKVLQDD